MKITLSIIKTDIGSIGGHIQPSRKLKEAVQEHVETEGLGKGLIKDFYTSSTGDDVAILMSHQKGKLDSDIHKLAWDAFIKGTEVAKIQGLYGAGQDLLKNTFLCNERNVGFILYDISALLRDNQRFVIEYIRGKYKGENFSRSNYGYRINKKISGRIENENNLKYNQRRHRQYRRSYQTKQGGKAMKLPENIFKGLIFKYKIEHYANGGLRLKEIEIGLPYALAFLIFIIIQFLLGN